MTVVATTLCANFVMSTLGGGELQQPDYPSCGAYFGQMLDDALFGQTVLAAREPITERSPAHRRCRSSLYGRQHRAQVDVLGPGIPRVRTYPGRGLEHEVLADVSRPVRFVHLHPSVDGPTRREGTGYTTGWTHTNEQLLPGAPRVARRPHRRDGFVPPAERGKRCRRLSSGGWIPRLGAAPRSGFEWPAC